MKALWAVLFCTLFLLAACDIPAAPTGTTTPVPPVTQPGPAAQHPAQTPPTISTPVHTPPSTGANPLNTTPPNATTLGIKQYVGSLGFQSPMFKNKQWAHYRITVENSGDTHTFERDYSVVTDYMNSDPCTGIERNSTVPGEFRTKNLWCGDVKYLLIWNNRSTSYSTPVVVGRPSHWEDNDINAFETKVSGLYQVTVPAGTFWTIKNSKWDGTTKKDLYASPLIPGFEGGLVKEVDIENGVTTTTELIDYDGV
jgi:hypothetical protein